MNKSKRKEYYPFLEPSFESSLTHFGSEPSTLPPTERVIDEFKNPAVTVDIAGLTGDCFNIILIKRKNEPFRGHWALPGGYLDYGKETLEEAAIREFKEETNITISDALTQYHTYSKPDRDPRGHTITTVFIYRVDSEQLKNMKAKDDAIEIKVFSFRKLPKLAFDHAKIIADIYNGIQ